MAPLAECSPNMWNRCQVELLELGYDIEKVLGSGSWGTVVKAFALEEPNCRVAIKIIDRSHLDEESWKSIEREVDAMTCLDDHPHIVQLHRVFETYNFVYLVMEFCSEGDLLTLVQESQTGLKESSSRVIFKQLLEATQHAHQNNYVHRDIKLENVFLADKCSVRMGDWGFARKLTPGEKVSEYCGSVHYSAPEICLGKPYKGFAVDVWSLGVTLYALNSGRLPFWGANEQAIVRKIRFGAYEMIDSFSESLKDLIVKCLEVDPSKRLSVEEMLQHPWVTGRPMRKLSHPARLADGALKCNSSPLPPTPEKFADKRRRAASFAVPLLDLQQLNLPTPLPLAPEEEEKAAELCTARRTARLADVPLLRQTSNATHRPCTSDPLSARKSVVQLTARLLAEAAEDSNTKTRKVTKLQGLLDNIGGFLHKKTKRRSSTEEHPKKTRRNQEKESTIKKGSLIRSSSSTL